jgi:Putative zinc-finger
MCNDFNIKELLPSYEEQALDPTDTKRVEDHLALCEECRLEASLLRTMVADVVPDPGDAFWSAMPDRIYRAVQEQKLHKKRFSISWFTDRLAMPRWVLAASTVGVAIVISLLSLRSLQPGGKIPFSPGYEFSDEITGSRLMNVSELSQDEAAAIDTWTGKELTSIAQEAEPVLVSNRNDDIDEELGELNSKEIQRLAQMLDQWKQQGG